MFVDITEQNGTFYMQREWCRTELVKEEDGGYRIGSLDEKIYFTDNGILYRLPGRVLTLTPAKPADPALFQEGTYYNDETDSFMKLVKVENTYASSWENNTLPISIRKYYLPNGCKSCNVCKS